MHKVHVDGGGSVFILLSKIYNEIIQQHGASYSTM